MDGTSGNPEGGRENGRSAPRRDLWVEREIEKRLGGRRSVARLEHGFDQEARAQCAAIANGIGQLMREFDFTRRRGAMYAAKGAPVEHIAEWIEQRVARQRALAEGLFALVEEFDRDLLRHLAFGDADEDWNGAAE